MQAAFSYEELVQRNIGFVTEAEQQRLRASSLLVLGIGGMGGACVQTLAGAGVGGFGLADFDVFEVSNLNRQVFATLDTIGRAKVEATVAQLHRINPALELTTYGADWIERLDVLLARWKIVVNGMDDVAAGIALYRKAREHGATVIDAYTAPLPSVTVVRPGDPRPEERLDFPTRGSAPASLPPEVLRDCVTREIEYVLANSSSARHIDLAIAKELVAGKRKRMSFAPMVITTGNLMAFETIKLLLGRSRCAGPRGYFFNPWTLAVEHPRNALSGALAQLVVRRFLARLMRD